LHSRLLSYFLAVYELGSISVAAEKLHITQPALSKSIQQLESAIGAKLFERGARGVVATPYADILARRVRLMDAEYRHALAEIDISRGGGHGLIRVGAGPVWQACLLPPIVARYLARNPDVRIQLQSGVIDTLVPGLIAGQFDIICTSLDFQPRPELISETLVSLNHVVVAGPDHPLLGVSLASAQQLGRYPWVVLTHDRVGTSRILGFFSAHGEPPPRIRVETSSPLQMFELMRQESFLAQIPDAMLPLAEGFGMRRVGSEGTFWNSPAGICYRREAHRPETLTHFIEAIRTQLPPDDDHSKPPGTKQGPQAKDASSCFRGARKDQPTP